MTEDDTFLKLRKPTYQEMRVIWETSPMYAAQQQRIVGITMYMQEEHIAKCHALFNSRGWTTEEYSDLRRKEE